MKTYQFLLLAFVSSLIMTSCDEVFKDDVVPAGSVTTRNASFSGYRMIDASHAFSVFVTFSDTEESIEIEANDNLHQHIEVRMENNTLKIGLERNVNIKGSATLNAYIVTRPIAEFAASGASRFLVEDEIIDEDVSVYLSGASSFTGHIDANRLYTDISGASLINISGGSTIFDVEASGASNIGDYEFATNFLKADLSGASNMSLTVMDEIDIEASGASGLNFKGSAVITHQDLSGSSYVNHH